MTTDFSLKHKETINAVGRIQRLLGVGKDQSLKPFCWYCWVLGQWVCVQFPAVEKSGYKNWTVSFLTSEFQSTRETAPGKDWQRIIAATQSHNLSLPPFVETTPCAALLCSSLPPCLHRRVYCSEFFLGLLIYTFLFTLNNNDFTIIFPFAIKPSYFVLLQGFFDFEGSTLNSNFQPSSPLTVYSSLSRTFSTIEVSLSQHSTLSGILFSLLLFWNWLMYTCAGLKFKVFFPCLPRNAEMKVCATIPVLKFPYPKHIVSFYLSI